MFFCAGGRPALREPSGVVVAAPADESAKRPSSSYSELEKEAVLLVDDDSKSEAQYYSDLQVKIKDLCGKLCTTGLEPTKTAESDVFPTVK